MLRLKNILDHALRLCVGALAAGSLAIAAHSQVRDNEPPPKKIEADPSYEEILDNLAGNLGRAHYHRILCVGLSDQSWREQMRRLLDLEAPQGHRNREALVAAFNDGYSDERRRYPVCSSESQGQARAIAANGRRLAQSLSARYAD